MPVRIDPQSRRDMQKLLRDLKKIEPATAKHTKRKLKDAAQGTATKARGRQKSKSGALRRSTKVAVRGGVASIVSNSDHSKIHEKGGRHPVYGDGPRSSWKWVTQKANPAIGRSVQEDLGEYLQQAKAAIYQACKEAGFK